MMSVLRPGVQERTDRVLLYIGGYYREHGYPPTVREVGAGTSLAPSIVAAYLTRLAQLGAISYEPGKSRTVLLTTVGAATLVRLHGTEAEAC